MSLFLLLFVDPKKPPDPREEMRSIERSAAFAGNAFRGEGVLATGIQGIRSPAGHILSKGFWQHHGLMQEGDSKKKREEERGSPAKRLSDGASQSSTAIQ